MSGMNGSPKRVFFSFYSAKDLGCTECLNPNDHTKPIQQVINSLLLCSMCTYNVEELL